MKKPLPMLLGLCTALGAHAQTSTVNLYGVFDTVIRHQNHDDLYALVAGQIQGSRWGLGGKEDLGGNASVMFNLEAGINPATGTSGQQGQVFGRQAWVALSGDAGKLTVGRQFGVGFDAIGADDPYGIANAGSIAWQFNLFGARFDNTVKYQINLDALSIDAAYSVGEVGGGTRAGRTLGLGVGYTLGAFTANVAAQQSSDIQLRKSTSLMMGGTYSIDAIKLFAAYVRTTRDQSFTPCSNFNATSGLVCQGGPLANTNLANGFSQGEAKTQYFQLGLRYRMGAIEMVAGFMNDRTSVAGLTQGAGHQTEYAVLDYYLSARTDVYTSLDYNKVNGSGLGNSAYAAYAGQPNQLGMTLGIRHRF